MSIFHTRIDFFSLYDEDPEQCEWLTVILGVCFAFSLPSKDTRGLFKNMSPMKFISVLGH